MGKAKWDWIPEADWYPVGKRITVSPKVVLTWKLTKRGYYLESEFGELGDRQFAIDFVVVEKGYNPDGTPQ